LISESVKNALEAPNHLQKN